MLLRSSNPFRRSSLSLGNLRFPAAGLIVWSVLTAGCDARPSLLAPEVALQAPLFQLGQSDSVPDPIDATTDLEGCNPLTAVMPCPTEPGTGGSSPFFANYDASLYEAPNDPLTGQPGVWLGSTVQPATCFEGSDQDADGLADQCEFPIARSFAPMLNYAQGENCPGGEPYWATRRTSTGRVRIAYLPAYYEDCGYDSHAGDSEVIVVEVAYNGSTQHWEFVRMWTSAHYQAGEGCSDWYHGKCDYSEWSSASQTSFHIRHLAFPSVWVAKSKHANYRSIARCDEAVGYTVVGFGFWDDVCSSGTRVRFPVIEGRNVGSSNVDLVGCISSLHRTYNRTECFFTDRDGFRGWYPPDVGYTASAGKYRTVLVNKFESE